MSDEPIPSLAEAIAEIRRLRAQLQQTAEFAFTSRHDAIELWRTEVEHLRARILEFEAIAAAQHGTLEKPTPDGPARFTHDVPPSAPPHDE